MPSRQRLPSPLLQPMRLELTQQVQARVDEGEWVQAGTLDLERRCLLTELFANHDIATLSAPTQELLRDILVQNNRIIHAVQVRKQELAAASSRLNRAPGAVRAYRQNTTRVHWIGAAAKSNG